MIRGDGSEGFRDGQLQVLRDPGLDPTQGLFQLCPGPLDVGVNSGDYADRYSNCAPRLSISGRTAGTL
jgi:hypothetical protein